MKPTAITIGVGDYLKHAEKSAELVRKHLGLETRIITDEHLHHALNLHQFKEMVWTLKYKIWDIWPDLDLVMYHDCDWRPVRDFDLADYLPDFKDVYFCLDRDNDHTKELEQQYRLKPSTYFNAGWFVANRKHKPIFDFCYKNYFRYENIWGDQCVSNQVFKNLVTLADKRLNVMDVNTNIPNEEVLAFHSSANYSIYEGNNDFEWGNPESQIENWDFAHTWITDKMHITEIYNVAKQYKGGKALEVGTFKAHGAKAMAMAGMSVKTIDISDEHLKANIAFCSPYLIDFRITSGEKELQNDEKYDVVFHDSYHGPSVIQELVQYYQKKVAENGVLIVHDVDSFDVNELLGLIGNPRHTITTDNRGRQLGCFYSGV